jgi:tRNA pseudouridine38-40 synthase
VERALSTVAAETIRVHCAGRTDTGVHASGQVIHFETDVSRPPRSWVLGGNSNLPRDISVQWAQPVADDFHARFSATARAYRYVIVNRTARSGLWSRKVTFVHDPIDACAMNESAQILLGEHDFSTFRAAGCQARHAVREVRRASVGRIGNFVILDIEANAFVQHMVRNIVGALLMVGKRLRDAAWFAEALRAKNRLAGGATAPPAGLYLTEVVYPERFGLPATESDPQPWLIK